jgi:hypothetical protein
LSRISIEIKKREREDTIERNVASTLISWRFKSTPATRLSLPADTRCCSTIVVVVVDHKRKMRMRRRRRI